MDDLLLHPKVRLALDNIVKQPPQSLLISGKAGSGKNTVALNLVANLLNIELSKLSSQAYVRITDHTEKSISIEEIRELKNFLRLKVPNSATINRIVFIERAERMGREAQNALLKTLEEPPESTVILLSSNQPDLLLDTIRSRTQILEILPVSKNQAKQFFTKSSDADISKFYALSQGHAGLLSSLINDTDHPLIASVDLAKQILAEKPESRILRTDELSKDKLYLTELFDAFLRLTHAGLIVSAQKSSAQTVEVWRSKQQSILTAIDQIGKNANTKLVLDNLFMSI